MKKKVNILGVDILSQERNELYQDLIDCVKRDEKKYLCVPNLNSVVMAQEDSDLKKIYNESYCNIPDSQLVVFASKFLGDKIYERIAGMDFFEELISKSLDFKHYLLGSSEEALESLEDKFYKKYELRFAGKYSPPYKAKFDDNDNKVIHDKINKNPVNILWVSLTCPKQEKWIYENLDKLNINLAIGVGAAFDVSAGLYKRAPKFLQNIGLEWFYRFLQEPKRLFSRYFIEGPIFFPLIIKQKFGK